MVQIIPQNPSFGTQIARGLSGGLSEGLLGGLQQRREQKSQMSLLQEKARLEQEAQRQKFSQEFSAEKENYESVKSAFGKEFADVWKSLGQGERTHLTKTALEARQRGIDLSEVIGKGKSVSQEPEVSDSSSDMTSSKKSSIPEYKLDTSGMNPKDVVAFKGSLRKENAPIWAESKERQKSYGELSRDIKVLDSLNEKKNLPEGLEKLLINPETGTPYDMVTAVKDMHPDVQRWVKTIARQATQAQKAFPGRVTNFDLTQYMRQFPSLFNTYDGRKIILQQMDLTNKANKLMEDALDKVYAKYKLSGITPEDAQSMAEDMVKDKIEEIDQKLLALSDEGEILASPESPNDVSSARLTVYDQNGNDVGDIDASEIDQLPEGFTAR